MTERLPRIRFLAFRAVVFLLFGVLVLRLWQLQIVSSQEYQQSADRNRFRLIPVDAPRGIIYDRAGRLLVRNVPSFTVSVVPAGLPEEPAARLGVLQRLSTLLGVPVDNPVGQGDQASSTDEPGSSIPVRGQRAPGIEQILKERAISPYAPVRVASNVDRQAAFILEEEHLKLPGVLVEAEPLRQYIDGPLVADIVGYVGRIPSERLKSYMSDAKQVYQPDDLVGLTGIELTQESVLRGVQGQKHVEVDAYEREVAVIAVRPPEQGNNLRLTVDLELQRVTENALREGMRNAGSPVGVAIVMDPRTGEILAMVSLPTYDNNLFSGGISYEDYARLSADKNHPLVNHAIGGQYPPGSTFKLVDSCGILEEHVVNRSTTVTCQGILMLPNRYFPTDPSKAQPFYCWNHGGHGTLNILGAIANSCDIFFYEVTGGYNDFPGLGVERLAKYARMLGYGEPSGVDLSGEAAGLIPSDRWKRENYNESWLTGDTYNAAIGQGYVLATPLQVLNATAAIANGGILYRPQLVYQVSNAEGKVARTLTPEPIRKLDVLPENLATVREGMRAAVSLGTAWQAQLPGITVAGKTGSAEYPAVDEQGKPIRNKDGSLPTHAWFTAFAPYEHPEIAVVVFLEGGGEGSVRCAPVTAKIMRYFFGFRDPEPPPATVPAPQATPTVRAASG